LTGRNFEPEGKKLRNVILSEHSLSADIKSSTARPSPPPKRRRCEQKI